MMNGVRIQSKTLLFFLLTLFIAQCGGTTAGIPSSTEGGVTGGQIYYDYGGGATGEDEAVTDNDTTDGDGDTAGGDSADGGTTGEGSYAPSDDAISIPVTIGKCEISTDKEAHALIKASTKTSNTKTVALGKTTPTREITLRGTPGTFDRADEEREVIVMNVNTGKISTTVINKNGSFDRVKVEARSTDDLIAVFMLDNYVEIIGNAVVFKRTPNTDAPETCSILTDEEKAFLADRVLDTDSFRLQ